MSLPDCAANPTGSLERAVPGPLLGAPLALPREEATAGRRPQAGLQQPCRLLCLSLQTKVDPLSHFSQRPPRSGRMGLPGGGVGGGIDFAPSPLQEVLGNVWKHF